MSAIPKGYKQTEVGVIPEAWEVVLLGTVAETSSGTTPSRALMDRYYRNGSIAWVKTLDLNNSFISATDEYVTEVALKETCLQVYPTGTVLVAMYGGFNQIGRTGLLQKSAAVNQAITAIRPKKSMLISDYLLCNLNYRIGYWKIVASSSRKDPNITSQDIRNFPIACPRPIEQHAIATALSDVDALISGLGQLIAKKRDLKQAAMQQLLTGKTRLPGFNGEWDVKRFGDFALPRRDRIDPRKTGVQNFCIELEHIASASGELLGSTSTGEQSSLKSVFQPGDVLFGKLRAYLRKYWLATCTGVCSTELWVLTPKDQLVKTEFLFQLVKTDEFIEVASNSYGTHMPRSDWNIVKNFEMALPPLPEQTAIAEVLSDLDAEIAALEARLSKTKALKQGMMQELLTGRIRLV
jgi:type I restriction enzyme S subunit